MTNRLQLTANAPTGGASAFDSHGLPIDLDAERPRAFVIEKAIFRHGDVAIPAANTGVDVRTLLSLSTDPEHSDNVIIGEAHLIGGSNNATITGLTALKETHDLELLEGTVWAAPHIRLESQIRDGGAAEQVTMAVDLLWRVVEVPFRVQMELWNQIDENVGSLKWWTLDDIPEAVPP